MKRIILALALTGFVFAVQAGDDKCCADKDKTGCCAKAKESTSLKSECPMAKDTKAQCPFATKNEGKEIAVKQALKSPKAGEASK